MVNSLVLCSALRRLASGIPRRLVLRPDLSLLGLYRAHEELLRGLAQGRSAAYLLRRKHGPDEGMWRMRIRTRV